MKVDIRSDFTEVSIEKNGVTKSKLVSLSELLDELSIYRSTNFGLLPRAIRVIESSGNHIVIGLEFEPKLRDLKYRGSKKQEVVEKCHVPGGMLFVKLRRDAGGVLKCVASRIFAIRGSRVSFPHDRLYRMPFPNVYDDGKICWGRVSIGDITVLSAIEGVISSFFSNNFNGDLFSGSKLSSEYDGPRDGFLTYFNHLVENEFLPDWLEPTRFSVDQMAAHLLQSKG